jgi:hypothetical protein
VIEEEIIEEDSKHNDEVRQNASLESTPKQKCKESVISSKCNILNSFPSEINDSYSEKVMEHSDDEVERRRGLEGDSSREHPKDPELLRQSTHSLLKRGRWKKSVDQRMGEEEVEMLGESYDRYLKNADNN